MTEIDNIPQSSDSDSKKIYYFKCKCHGLNSRCHCNDGQIVARLKSGYNERRLTLLYSDISLYPDLFFSVF
jgi:hypothetical protein